MRVGCQSHARTHTGASGDAAAEVVVQQLELLEADHAVAISIESRCRTP